MRNMRSLSMSRMSSTSIGPDDFKDFGVELEDLQITRAQLSNIQSHAFKHVRGLKRLDFSENAIQTIENDAFDEVGRRATKSSRKSHIRKGKFYKFLFDTM